MWSASLLRSSNVMLRHKCWQMDEGKIILLIEMPLQKTSTRTVCVPF